MRGGSRLWGAVVMGKGSVVHTTGGSLLFMDAYFYPRMTA